MINCMRAWNYIQKISSSPLNIKTIKIMMNKEMMDNHGQDKIMMDKDDGKDT